MAIFHSYVSLPEGTFYILYQYLVSWGKLGRYRPGWFHCLEDGLKAATGKYRSFSVYAEVAAWWLGKSGLELKTTDINWQFQKDFKRQTWQIDQMVTWELSHRCMSRKVPIYMKDVGFSRPLKRPNLWSHFPASCSRASAHDSHDHVWHD